MEREEALRFTAGATGFGDVVGVTGGGPANAPNGRVEGNGNRPATAAPNPLSGGVGEINASTAAL
jgi:hypothetical protein